MVSDPGPFSLNCLFLAICPYFKVIQLFLKVFYFPGYMVGRCGEQFCEQDLLSGPLCCQKSLNSTPKSVLLYALTNLICPSEPIFVQSNQNYDHFPNPLIKGFQDVNLKRSHYITFLDFIAGLSDSLLSGGKHEKKLLEMVKLSFSHFKGQGLYINDVMQIWGCLNPPPHLCH